MTYILARVINLCFGQDKSSNIIESNEDEWTKLHAELVFWSHNLPTTYKPYSQAPKAGNTFPSEWYLRPWHIAAAQYFLTAKTLLLLQNPDTQIDIRDIERLCGIAYTNENKAARVNAFGPMAFCKLPRSEQDQQADMVQAEDFSRVQSNENLSYNSYKPATMRLDGQFIESQRIWKLFGIVDDRNWCFGDDFYMGLGAILFLSMFFEHTNMFPRQFLRTASAITARRGQIGGRLQPTRESSSTPITVAVTSEELVAKKLGWHNLELATRALHRDGLVVLQDVIEHSKLDALNKTMVQDALKLQALGDDGPFNYNKGNIQQDPPMTKSHFNSSIFLNPLTTQVTTSVLGPKPRLTFMSGNSALPPVPGLTPQSQPVHTDADFDHPESPFALVVNVPLIDMDINNGSTEVWLGTHNITSLAAQEGKQGDRASGRIAKHLLEQRKQERGPCQPVVKKGSIIIRDLRLWHAGKPNFSNDVRVMLAMIHFAPWYRNSMRIEFSEDLETVLDREGSDLQIQRTLVSEQTIMDGYLNRGYGNSYNFDQESRPEHF
ncbi:phytanoyl-CoA dioxygenase family protein, partial [Aureobasidium melanogenum]